MDDLLVRHRALIGRQDVLPTLAFPLRFKRPLKIKQQDAPHTSTGPSRIERPLVRHLALIGWQDALPKLACP